MRGQGPGRAAHVEAGSPPITGAGCGKEGLELGDRVSTEFLNSGGEQTTGRGTSRASDKSAIPTYRTDRDINS